MNISQLTEDLKVLSIAKTLEDPTIASAIRKAGFDLAWHLDIPELNISDTVTVVSGKVDYIPELTTGEEIDRITSAVFVGNVKQPLNPIDINTFDADYRGVGNSGTPFEYVFYENKIGLYYIPSSDGIVYLRMQKVFNSFEGLRESYYPVVFALAKRNLVDEKSIERQVLERDVQRLISTFKGRVRPYKQGFELSPHRTQRVQGLSGLY